MSSFELIFNLLVKKYNSLNKELDIKSVLKVFTPRVKVISWI